MKIGRLLVLCMSLASAAGGPRCLECRDMPHPNDCDTSTVCGDSQECHVEQIVTSGGLILYNSGCLSKMRCGGLGKRDIGGKYDGYNMTRRRRASTDIVTCQECCHGNHCNNHGCGSTVIRRSDLPL